MGWACWVLYLDSCIQPGRPKLRPLSPSGLSSFQGGSCEGSLSTGASPSQDRCDTVPSQFARTPSELIIRTAHPDNSRGARQRLASASLPCRHLRICPGPNCAPIQTQSAARKPGAPTYSFQRRSVSSSSNRAAAASPAGPATHTHSKNTIRTIPTGGAPICRRRVAVCAPCSSLAGARAMQPPWTPRRRYLSPATYRDCWRYAGECARRARSPADLMGPPSVPDEWIRG
ncbi:hypothetical protein BV25DRAFT_995655 [Artomyces pyxidatus]|uniref:Uncharacterized protein n=1 Tax=Artomyces pyxidatus TaxID=48021 RepID=A0ACB8STJ0_9AGAM|nr:hypothetical protein BV25DRAFT_995655 [Artomyces pyxidatus]